MSSRTYETDVLVAGSGMAGWTVARRCQAAGLDVTVVDKGTAGPGRCNARVSQGFLNAAYLGMTEDPAVLKTYAREVTSGA
jgi:flavin-dependent dehydrogenase